MMLVQSNLLKNYQYFRILEFQVPKKKIYSRTYSRTLKFPIPRKNFDSRNSKFLYIIFYIMFISLLFSAMLKAQNRLSHTDNRFTIYKNNKYIVIYRYRNANSKSQ